MKSLSQSIETAFSLYFKNFKSYTYMVLVIGAVFFATIFLSLFTLFGRETLNTLNTITENPSSIEFLLSTTTGTFDIVLSTVFAMLGFCIAYALLGGAIGFTRDLLRKKKIDAVNDMINIAKKKGVTLISARVLSFLLLVASIVLISFLGGVISLILQGNTMLWILFATQMILIVAVSVMFWMTDQAVVIENLRTIDALKHAYQFGKRNFLDLFILFMLFAVLSNLLSLVPLVGFLVNMFVLVPVTVITTTDYYLRNVRIKK